MTLSSILISSILSLAISASKEVNTAPLVNDAILNATPQEVWKAWTTKEGIESWMVAKTEIDLKVGALWKTSYSKDSTLDDDGSIHQQILSMDPGRMLSFRTVKSPKNFPYAEPIAKTWVVVYLEPVGGEKTHVTVKMLGFGEDALSQDMRSKFAAGNKYTVDKLVERFNKK